MKTWRTSSRASGLRTWQDGLAAAFVRMDAEPIAAGTFRGKIEQSHMLDGQVSRVQATSHRVLRRSEHIARRRSDMVFANLQVAGRGLVELPGMTCETAPMDLCVVPTFDAYTITHSAPFELFSIALPQSALPDNLGPGLISLSASAAGRELAGVLAGLGALALHLPDGAATIEQQIRSTLSLITSLEGEVLDQEALRQAIEAFIARQHTRPGLSAAPIAAAFGLSERQAHLLFERTGHTIGARIEDARLTTAQSLLATTILPISKVAARSGFRDPGYFARVFRRQFGMSPRDWRFEQSS